VPNWDKLGLENFLGPEPQQQSEEKNLKLDPCASVQIRGEEFDVVVKPVREDNS
jgi:hypothetical protein